MSPSVQQIMPISQSDDSEFLSENINSASDSVLSRNKSDTQIKNNNIIRHKTSILKPKYNSGQVGNIILSFMLN